MRVAIKKLMVPCDDEVSLMAQIRHRNIVTCLGYCAHPPEFCMVMELAKYNLKHVRPRLKKHGPGLVLRVQLRLPGTGTGLAIGGGARPYPALKSQFRALTGLV